ncbi:Oxygen regulatory protein NreC [Pontiella desulfatans]|uniref:Oxygen regulatory protein NreC n=1 Tax=Pontiella desulfatans TaxID=2750659 RepID=A0A6C2TZW4_PONDE|nr:response regulator transcription factor [Pontiella desulfatans]VGO13153.1 Oxygen regulatory protein NreC [Pontiella desulfatans]
MKRKIKVMLVEDHAGYREVITRALKNQDAMELISQFGTAEIALRSLQDMSTRNEPDIILLDLNLPGISGLEAQPFFAATLPDTQIIILTQSDKKAEILQAIQQGAKGYLLKSSTAKQIREGIETVMEGGASLDPGIARFILGTMGGPKPKASLEKNLSVRELQVLELLADGLVKKEIASTLKVSVTTVADHVRHIYEKLEVQNAPAAVHRAHRLGLFHRDN